MATTMARITVSFPKELLDDLRAYVPARRRSAVIAEAVEKEVRRLRTQAALDAAFGAWSDEDHPELATGEDIDRYIREMRSRWRPAEEDSVA